MDASAQLLGLTLQVFLLDLLLSGDNAVVIALACRGLPEQQRRQAILAGTAGAIIGRVLLTGVATLLMEVPLLKLTGGIALLVIAIRLLRAEEPEAQDGGAPASTDFWSVLATIVIADIVMSTDNVVALAGLSNGNLAVLVLGLLGSVPFLMYGSWWVTRLLDRYPVLVSLGAALLGWVAGGVAVSDPLYGDWVDQQAPGLSIVVPALAAVYVLVQSRIIDANAERAQVLRPAPWALPEPPSAMAESEVETRPVEPAASPVLPLASAVSLSEAAPQASEVSAAASDDVHASASPAMALAVPPAAVSAPPAPSEAAALPDAVAESGAEEEAELEADLPLWRSAGTWLAVGGVALVIGTIVVLRGIDFMPTPKDLVRYDCTQGGVTVYYRFGGTRFRIESANASANGTVRADNQIDWGDLHATSRTLGFVPPTRVLNASAYSLGIDGGMFEDVACTAR